MYKDLSKEQKSAIDSLEQWLEAECPHVKVVKPIDGDVIDVVGFNMNFWETNIATWTDTDNLKVHSVVKTKPTCGTVCCMGGYLDQVHPDVCWQREQFDSLFYPTDAFKGNWDDITPAEALAVLRKWKETGEIDWWGATQNVEYEDKEDA